MSESFKREKFEIIQLTRTYHVLSIISASRPIERIHSLIQQSCKFITFYYKLRLIKLFPSVFIGEAPAALSVLDK